MRTRPSSLFLQFQLLLFWRKISKGDSFLQATQSVEIFYCCWFIWIGLFCLFTIILTAHLLHLQQSYYMSSQVCWWAWNVQFSINLKLVKYFQLFLTASTWINISLNHHKPIHQSSTSIFKLLHHIFFGWLLLFRLHRNMPNSKIQL